MHAQAHFMNIFRSVNTQLTSAPYTDLDRQRVVVL